MFVTKLGGISQNFGIVHPKYHDLIYEMSILPSFIKILMKASIKYIEYAMHNVNINKTIANTHQK